MILPTLAIRFRLTQPSAISLRQFHHCLGPSSMRKHINRLDIVDIVDLTELDQIPSQS